MAKTRARRAQKTPMGFPASDESQRMYDEADLNRATQAYRFFYPTVSGAAILRGNADIGVVDNTVFGILDTKPRHVGFTYNSDTPYGMVQRRSTRRLSRLALDQQPAIGWCSRDPRKRRRQSGDGESEPSRSIRSNPVLTGRSRSGSI